MPEKARAKRLLQIFQTWGTLHEPNTQISMPSLDLSSFHSLESAGPTHLQKASNYINKTHWPLQYNRKEKQHKEISKLTFLYVTISEKTSVERMQEGGELVEVAGTGIHIPWGGWFMLLLWLPQDTFLLSVLLWITPEQQSWCWSRWQHLKLLEVSIPRSPRGKEVTKEQLLHWLFCSFLAKACPADK